MEAGRQLSTRTCPKNGGRQLGDIYDVFDIAGDR